MTIANTEADQYHRELTAEAVELVQEGKANNNGGNAPKLAALTGKSQVTTKTTNSVDNFMTSSLGKKRPMTSSRSKSELADLRIMPHLRYDNDQQAFYIDQTRSYPELALVEVDLSSATSLVQKLRTLGSLQSVHATAPRIRADLESLVEHSNFLFDNRPALLDLAVRASICQAKTIQYGARRGSDFQIIATNDLIKEGIVSIATFFTHLARDESTPFRSRLLYAVLLLLSMVGDVDLHEISDVLESTYNLEADRAYLELLFLKFLPREASTPKAFLQYVSFFMVGPQSTDMMDLDTHIGQSHCWDACLLQVLDRGFLLPASTLDLGRDNFSWISKWPEGGYKSSEIFKNLQSTASGPRALFDLAFDELHLERKLWWKSVIMTGGREYSIQATDCEKITSMVPGRYLGQETSGSYAYLVIEEQDLNSDTFKAMKKINKAIAELRKKSITEQPPPACQWSGKLQQTSAVIEKKVLALNFKLNGKDVYRNNAARAMSQDTREATESINKILGQLAQTKHLCLEIRQTLREAVADLELARQARAQVVVADEFDLNSNPISKLLTEPSVAPLSVKSHWSEYKAWFEGVNTRLHIEALRSVVLDVKWLASHTAQVSLHGFETEYVVTTLAPFPEVVSTGSEFDDIPTTLEGTPAYEAVHAGYYAILAGQYLIMADRLDKGYSGRGEVRMRNYLRILKTEITNSYDGDEGSLAKGSKVLSIFH